MEYSHNISMIRTISLITFCFLNLSLFAQNIEQKIEQVEQQLTDLEKKQQQLIHEIEDYKLQILRRELKKNGLPKLESSEKLIEHSAMSLVYSEEHEQAKWVAHIIMPDVTTGNAARSNDFREDPKVSTGTAIEQDYFLTNTLEDGTIEYDGFGYDRGHLAPSADFRWSTKALSESYYYSNMSPQRPEFNREGWGELEGMMRGYMYHNPGAKLYVVTGPVLEEGLPPIERSINKPSIPKHYFKVALDLENEKAIGFVMPNQRLAYPIETFAKSIDEIEELTGIDFFHNLPDAIESKLEKLADPSPWMHQSSVGDVLPLYAPGLPKNHFNTIQAKRWKNRDKKVTVCGTVVHAKKSKKGNTMLYLDKGIADPVFIVFIREEDMRNFSMNLLEDLNGETVAVTEKIGKIGETPTMFIKNEKQLLLFHDTQ